MSNEHNPIAVLISKIQDKWNTEASPNKDFRIARWIIKADQGRLFEGFLRLEGTAHGSIPEVVVTLLTPFKDIHQHGKSLALQWIKSFEEDQTAHQAIAWDYGTYVKSLAQDDADGDSILLQMLDDFQKKVPDPSHRLILALLPQTVADADEYGKWLHKLLKIGIPDKVALMIFDYAEGLYFDALQRKHSTLVKALTVELDLKGAMNQLAQAGDPNSPEVQFRQCMTQMGEAASANNIDALHKWGKKGLEITQRTGNKGFYSSAHIIYAGMLFQFKKFDQIELLLDQGLRLAQEGLKTGDNSCQALEIQYWGYKAACLQHKGKHEEAAALFVKQGEKALSFNLPAMALGAWWQAYQLYKKEDEQQYLHWLEKAYELGISISPEELGATCMAYVAYDYHEHCHDLRQFEKCTSIDTFMTELHGPDWKTAVETYKKDSKRKRFLIF